MGVELNTCVALKYFVRKTKTFTKTQAKDLNLRNLASSVKGMANV